MLVVDDSAVVRQVMQGVLGSDPKIKVMVAADPIIAFSKIQREMPDVVITDLVMPRMDGLTFLKKLMAEMPLPVIVCSEVAHHRTEDAISALELGAVEVIKKPKLGVRGFLEESRVMLLDVVRSAAQARVVVPAPSLPVSPKNTADVVLRLGPLPRVHPAGEKIIAVGASTGGTEALRDLLQAMPPGCPGIVVVQHMPEVFTRAFAERLNRDCHIEVKEAADGDRILPGRALIAPGNHHLLVQQNGSGYVAHVMDGPLVSRHRPSVDVLFRSVAKTAWSSCSRRDHDWHGRRWCARLAGNAQLRLPDNCAGRSQLRGLWYAERSDCSWRRSDCASACAYRCNGVKDVRLLRVLRLIWLGAEFKPLHFPGGGFRKFGKEFHPVRTLEDRQPSNHKLL